VHITKTPDWPPDSRKSEYSPCQSDFAKPEFQPFESNLMVHYYRKTHSACCYPQILKRIPRKLNGKLKLSSDGDPQTGWGIHLSQGLHKGRFLLIGFSGLIGCCLLGAIWSIVRNDVQGGTGIASCLMYFIGFAVAAVTYGT
jgi:hypothetical protein